MAKEQKDILKNLNKEQIEAATHKSGPLLIVAGAGTGKTTVITRRIAWLIMETGVKPEEILALTFTNKAAEEMEERVDKILPYGYVNLWISTFHNFAQKFLQDKAFDIGISPDSELLDTTGQWLLVKQNFDKFNLNYYAPLGNPTKFIKAMLSHFSRLKDEDISPKDYLEYAQNLALNADDMEASGGKSSKNSNQKDSKTDEARRIGEIANAYHVYQKLLLDNGKMDFGDLINYALKILRDRKNVLEEYRKKFKYILVDEFQDTNWAQYELVKALAAPENNLTVVADDDQSIYRFRGASMSNVIVFNNDYPKSKKVSLTKNYRSGQEILDLAYDFIQLNNPNRLEARLARNSSKKSAADFKLDKKLKTQTNEKSSIAHLHCETDEDEAKIVAQTILEIKNKDKSVSWNDFAILVRANNHAQIFEDALVLSKIPYQNISSVGLYNTTVVSNILSFLRVIDDNYNEKSAFRLLNLSYLDISVEDITKLNYFARRKQINIFDLMAAPQKAGINNEDSLKKISNLYNQIQAYSQRAKSEKVTTILLDWLNKGGYFEYINNLPDADTAESYRLINNFWSHLKEIEANTLNPRARDIVEAINLEIESGDKGDIPQDVEAGPEMVKLMTIHSAKGLEFRYVFIVNLVDKRFPSVGRSEPIKIPDELVKEVVGEGDVHIEEERRLFYVGITRAKSGLFFTTAQDYGGATKKKVSRFLKELEDVNNNFKISSQVLGDGIRLGTDKTNQEKLLPKNLNLYLPSKFSFTQLKDFETCPYMYKMKYILKAPSEGKHFFSYGTTMHSTLQSFLQQLVREKKYGQSGLFGQAEGKTQGDDGLPISLDELLNIYEQKWVDDWYNSPEEKNLYFQEGKKALKKFYQNLGGQVPEVKALERSFNLRIGDYTIVGKVDRVDIEKNPENKDNFVSVIDYKTGKPKEKLTVNDKEQLLIYQIACENVFNEKVEKLIYYYLDGGVKKDFLGSISEKEKLKTKIISIIEEIKTSDFSPNPGRHFCEYCENSF